MKASSLALLLAAGAVCSAEERNELSQPQSAPRPAPAGITYIDQGKHDARLKGYKTPDGFKLEIACEEPAIINPVGMTFGPDGALYVLEWTPDANTWPETPEKITYKDGSTRTIATMKKKVKDVVKVLTWNPEKKLFGNPRVILEDELPSSILIYDGWLYLSGRGTIRRWKLEATIDGSNPRAKPEIIAQGFCGFHHHQVSGLTIGLDGWLYITSGDDDNYVEGSDGSRATVLRTGAVFRCRPDGSRMHVFSIGYRNPYRDAVQDCYGNWFHVDNDNEDGSKFTGCRLMHVAEESDFGWRLFTGARCCKPDPVRGAVFGELAGKLPPMLKTGRGAPAGLLIYNDTQLPAFYRGLIYYPDVFRKLIRCYRVASAGSTFRVTHEFEFLRSDDPLFRPCQMVTGPDGAIYICDWRTDSGGAGKLFGDGLHGRIYRMSWSGGMAPGQPEEVAAIEPRPWDTWANLVSAKAPNSSLQPLLDAQASSDFTVRLRAQREYLHCVRGPKEKADGQSTLFVAEELARTKLIGAVAEPGQALETRVVALSALNRLWNDQVRDQFLAWLLNDPSPEIRRLAADGLALNGAAGDLKTAAALQKALGDTEAPVRRAALLALGRINNEGGAEAIVTAYKFDDGKDVYLTDAYYRALERCGKKGIEQLLGLATSGDEADLDRAVSAFLALRTREAADAIPELLINPHLSDPQRVGVIKSYTNYLLDPPVSLEPLLEYLTDHPKAPLTVQIAAIETLADTGNLRGAKAVNMLTNLLDGDGDTRLAAIQAIEKARLGEAAPRLIQAIADGNRNEAERLAILKALRVLNDKNAAGVLTKIFDSPEPSSIRIEALRTLAAVDPTAAQPIAIKLLEQADAALQSEAIQALAATPAGAKIVGQRFIDKKLSHDLLPQVSEALRRHLGKDPEIARLLTDVMKGGLLLSVEPGQVEKVRHLVATRGSAQRGKSLYLGSRSLQCVNCHKLEGVGGQVGPDLTRIWETATVEKIMEAIIEPSKEIKEGFQSFKATTKNGQTFTGLKVVDLPKEITIRDANGKDIRILREDIEDVSPSKISLMPDGVVGQLTFDEFIDVIAFLKSREAQESLRGIVTEFWTVGPFGNDLQAAYGPEIKTNELEKYLEDSGLEMKWQRKNTEPNGYLDLRAPNSDVRASAYALTYVYSPKEQSATMSVGAEGAVRVWVNGELAHEQAKLQGMASPERDRIRVNLKQGWNAVLAKVVSRDGARGLYLRFKGEEIRASIKKD